jgi:hypothetical protein
MVQVQKYKSNIFYKGKPISIVSVKSRNLMNIDFIKKKFEEFVAGLIAKNHKGRISLVLQSENKSYITVMKFIDIRKAQFGEIIDEELMDYFGRGRVAAYDASYLKFIMKFTTEDDVEEVGDDRTNDCLYNCLIELVPEETTKAFPTPESLKEFLGLARCSKVQIAQIPLIEEKLQNVSIRILGDMIYTPTKNALKSVTLHAYETHLSVAKNSINYCNGVSLTEKRIAIFQVKEEDSTVLMYNGEKTFSVDIHLFRKWKKNMKYNSKNSSPYMLIAYKPDNGTMESQWYNFMIDAVFLDTLTDGNYNLFKCGSIKNCILNRFYELNPALKADAIEQDEAEWISDCHLGGLIWAQKGYQGEAYKYDINSCYPAILSQQRFSFPIKRGNFKIITNEDFNNMKFIEFGIYRAKISKHDNKLFVTKTKYTHIDLNRAKELGYKIELIEDGKPNLLSYGGKGIRVDGRVFKTIIDELYKLKKEYGTSFPLIKLLLNYLWGSLCQRKKIIYYKQKDKKYILPKCSKLVSIDRKSKHVEVITSTNEVDQFTTPFARLGPFLLARCRTLMSHFIGQNYDSVVRVYTDGLISNKKLHFESTNKCKLENLGAGADIGQMKYEGHAEYINIINASTIVDKNCERCLNKEYWS